MKTKDKLTLQLELIMSTREGRAWMWDHLSVCGVFRTSFTPNSLEMSFNEGQRNVGLRVLNDLHEHAFKEYQMMEAENRDSKEVADETDTDD